MALASCPARQSSSGHTPVVRITARRISASLTSAQAPGHAARLGARQAGQRRTDHLFLCCTEQYRRRLEPAR